MNMSIHAERVLIIDFGSQYTQLIARRVREMGVFCEVYDYRVSEARIREFSPKGIILSGGPESVCENNSPRAPACVFELGCPVLGICYGMQTMAVQLGGQVKSVEHREFGSANIEIEHESLLLSGMQKQLHVWMSHGDQVSQLPPGFSVLASTPTCPLAAMMCEEKHFYGLQFHPEVTHTAEGYAMLEQFLMTICHCKKTWTISNIIQDAIEKIREKVGDEHVLLALSGGVDSSVAAELLHRAIGDQLICVFVDTGLLRLNEADQVMDTFAKHLGIKVIKVEAKKLFFNALENVIDPEEKRKTIGKLFIDVFEAESNKLTHIKWLAQGTIYSDVIESAKGGDSSHVIKSHHNVGGLPDTMNLKLIEPLRELFKDEVRKVGVELGLSPQLLFRHPFPGPGLALRVLGEVKEDYVELLQKADAIFIEELRASGWYEKTSQAFCVFLPVKSVAVMGDARQYSFVIALRAVETVDFMTARWADLPHALLAKVSARICNEVPHVSRVVYDVTDKPPATIEWE